MSTSVSYTAPFGNSSYIFKLTQHFRLFNVQTFNVDFSNCSEASSCYQWMKIHTILLNTVVILKCSSCKKIIINKIKKEKKCWQSLPSFGINGKKKYLSSYLHREKKADVPVSCESLSFLV